MSPTSVRACRARTGRVAADAHRWHRSWCVGNLRLHRGRRLRRLPAVRGCRSSSCPRSGRTPSPPSTPSLWRTLPSGSVAQRADRPGARPATSPAGCCTPTRSCATGESELRPRRAGVGARTAGCGNPPSPRTGRGGGSTGCRSRWTDADATERLAAYWTRSPAATRTPTASLAALPASAPPSWSARCRRRSSPNPPAAEQIWWHWNYTASRGVWRHPLPTQPYDPAAQPARPRRSPRSTSIPAAAQLRGRRWRAARTDAEVFVRTYRDADDGVPDSYQALVALDSFPDTGIAWPRATLFKVLDDLTTPDITLDWTIHITFATAETAVSVAQNVITNIHDQYRQRGPARRLRRRTGPQAGLGQGIGLRAQARRRRTRRQPRRSSIAAAGADPDTVNAALAAGDPALPRGRTSGARRWRGSQPTLWRAFNPGTERAAALGEFRNPTTTARFAKFVPLLATTARQQHRRAAGHEPHQPGPARRRAARSAQRARPGEPGQPGDLRVTGPRQVPRRQAADPVLAGAGRRGAHLRSRASRASTSARWPTSTTWSSSTSPTPACSLDPLRIFPLDDAAEHAVDHLLPLLGYSAMSRQAARLRSAPRRGDARRQRHRQPRPVDRLPARAAARPRPRRRRPAGRAGGAAHRTAPARRCSTSRCRSPICRGAAAVVWNIAGLELPTRRRGVRRASARPDHAAPACRRRRSTGWRADLAQCTLLRPPAPARRAGGGRGGAADQFAGRPEVLQPDHPPGPQVAGPGSSGSASTRSRTSRCSRTSSSTSGCVWRSRTPGWRAATLRVVRPRPGPPPRAVARLRRQHQPGAGSMDHGDDAIDSRLRRGDSRPRGRGVVSRRVRRLRQGAGCSPRRRPSWPPRWTPTRAEPARRGVIARLYVWYADHPRLGRPCRGAGGVQVLAIGRGVRGAGAPARPPTRWC